MKTVCVVAVAFFMIVFGVMVFRNLPETGTLKPERIHHDTAYVISPRDTFYVITQEDTFIRLKTRIDTLK